MPETYIVGQKVKSQSAMEYLMTYGWAILIIAVVLGTLFQLGVFSSGSFAAKVPPGSCQLVREGTGTTQTISLAGECTGELPQYVVLESYTSSHQVLVPESKSMDTAWSGGSWTITAWFDGSFPANTATSRDLIEEWQGCTSGLWVNNVSSSGYSVYAIEWYQNPAAKAPGNGACTSVGGVSSSSTGKIPFNTWAFVVATFNYSANPGGNYLETCYDANCISTAWSAPDPPEDYAYWTYEFPIEDNDCCAGLTGGMFADVQLYNDSLSPSELKALYMEGIGGAPIRPQNLVGWWPLNGNGNDYSGNGNNGQISSASFTSQWTSQYTPP